MTRSNQGIIAIYSYLDDLTQVLHKIKDDPDFTGYDVISHTSYHELIEFAELRYGRSEVRWFTLFGALIGMATGFLMPLLMDYDWPIVVGGKTPGIYSLPAYVILSFELMILFGATATILGMLVMGRIPNPKGVIHDPRLTDDRFAIIVPGAGIDGHQAELLRKWGAEDIRSTLA